MSKLLQAIPEVDYTKTLKNNAIFIRENIYSKANSLINKLEAQEKNRVASTGIATSLKKEDVDLRLSAEIQNLIETNPLIQGQKPLQKTANALLTKTLDIIDSKTANPC